MVNHFRRVVLLSLGCILPWGPQLQAESPWASLIPFKRIEADPKKSYELTEEHGPWLILTADFTGPDAMKQARELVLELRSRYRLPAYIHKQTYDFTQPAQGTMIDQYGYWARMRYANESKYDALAVLVGNFRSADEPELAEALKRIKTLSPDCLAKSSGNSNKPPFAMFSGFDPRAKSRTAKKGPLGSAFATRNPLLPDELFSPSGVDDFVARLNKGVEYSLLENPGRFTVRVATFRGKTTINQRQIKEIRETDRITDKLEVAADKAHRLTVALRERGVEAYEFHDRTESIVTVGSFQEGVWQFPNGAEISPEIRKVMEQYRGTQRSVPGRGVVGIEPRRLAGVTFDVEPWPMEVPRRSVAADYVRRQILE